MPELHQTEIDGVQCFWVDSGRPTLSALLLFRQGMADESLPESGWLHLLEHLALHGRGGGALHVNGSVGMLHTTFDVHGPHAGVTAHLADVTRWLSEPVFHEFERERDVLRAEAGMRGNAATRAIGWRYGAQGPGLVSHDEPGIGRATPTRLTERSRRVFNRRNGVLVLDGPPPADLRLSLPDGEHLMPRSTHPVDGTVPTAYVEDGGLVVSGVVRRTVAATVAQEILQRALRDRLRDQAGAAYAPWASYEPVDVEHAVLLGGSDVLPKLLPELAGNVFHLIHAMRTEPVPEQWLTEVVEGRTQQMQDPYQVTAVAGRAAHLHLLGQPPQTMEEILEELHGVSNEAVVESLVEFSRTLLVGVPGKTTWRDEVPMSSFPEGYPRHEGAGFRSADWPASPERLHVSRDRLEISRGDVARAVDLTRAAGLYVFEDGGRYVVGRDGWGLHVLPGAWRNGGEAVRALDAAVPVDLHLPQPAREGAQHTRLSAARRWGWGARRLVSRVPLEWVGILVLCVVAVVSVVSGIGIVAIVCLIGSISIWREWRGRTGAASQGT